MGSILVTGGAGFIGSHVAAYYDRRAVDVTALDNLSRIDTLGGVNRTRDTSSYNWRYLAENHPDVERVRADIRDADRMEAIVEGHDAVVHTAGQVAVTASLNDPRTDFEINTEGTFNVLEAARKADDSPAVVFASTNKVYGSNVNEIPIREEETRYQYADTKYEDGVSESFPVDACRHTPYGVSKLGADLYLQDYARRSELEAAAFRMSCIYGPRQFGNEAQGWIAHFSLSSLDDDPITIYGDGKQVRDVLYVEDLVRAYDTFLSDPNGKPAVYNVGGGPENTTSLLEFVDALNDRTDGDLTVNYDDWRDGDQRVYISDISRAKQELGWEPTVNLESGIDQCLDWYRSYEQEVTL